MLNSEESILGMDLDSLDRWDAIYLVGGYTLLQALDWRSNSWQLPEVELALLAMAVGGIIAALTFPAIVRLGRLFVWVFLGFLAIAAVLYVLGGYGDVSGRLATLAYVWTLAGIAVLYGLVSG